MADWEYDQQRWAETRQVTIAQDPDGMWRWWRTRTGPDDRVVSQCVSGGFDDPKWCYRNAVKENVGLDVAVPEGVEVFNVVPSSNEPDASEDDMEDADTEPQPPVPSNA